MSSIKKIAFVFGRPKFDSAKLQYMPFALSALKRIAEKKANQIDLFVTQSKTTDYYQILPSNVNVVFLDKKFIWKYGSGRILYFLLNIYFYIDTLFRKYEVVWGVGQVGVVLGGKLSERKRAKFICLNDEFPDISYLRIWREMEIRYTALASTVVLPDECRIAILKEQVPFGNRTSFITLPNIPPQIAVDSIEEFDWIKRLKLNADTKIILYAGGITQENNIDYLLSVFPFTDPVYTLVMVGNGPYVNNRYLKDDRIIWIQDPLGDDELHSLIRMATCCICYYADFLKLEYVGKSSGKIMRSLLLGTPVITTKFASLNFIEEDGMGILITKPKDLVRAIVELDENQAEYRVSIKENIHKYTFELYWSNFQTTLQHYF